MRITLLFLFSLLCTLASAQSWSYVGSSCPNTEGSARFKIKSNGNIFSAAFSFNQLYLKEWNGSTWQNVPSPNVSGIIGGLQVEIYQDTIFLAVINNGLKVFKWGGSSWISQGSINESFSDSNHDFLLDNNGVPYVGNAFTRKIFRFNGSAWQVVHTLPLGGFPNTYAYHFGTDNSLIFNSANQLVYSCTFKNRQMIRSLSSTFTDQLLGDTAVVLAPFSQYASILKKNGSGEIFVLFSAFGKRPFVKKLNGSSWQLYGDSSTFGLAPGTHLMEIGQNGALVFGQSGGTDKKIWAVSSASASFQLLDLISHTGNFTQLTDLEISPVDGKPHVAFNCIPTHSLMRYDQSITNLKPVQNDFLDAKVYPNPSAGGLFHFDLPETETGSINYRVLTLDGKTIQNGVAFSNQKQRLDLRQFPKGLYHLKIQSDKGVTTLRLMKN